MRIWHTFVLLLILVPAKACGQQITNSVATPQQPSPAAPAETEQPYSRRNTWSAFAEFSPSSHHVVLGVSEQRRIVSIGGEYARRLVLKPWFEMDYLVQVRPLFWERDPKLAGVRSIDTHQVLAVFPHGARVTTIDHSQFVWQPQDVLAEHFYTPEWTYAGGLNPIGFKWSFAPHRKLQPTATFATGFIASTRALPVDKSASFNFTFEAGLGVEYYWRARESVRVEYRLHHLSNAYRGTLNPGIDSNLVQISYSFGH